MQPSSSAVQSGEKDALLPQSTSKEKSSGENGYQSTVDPMTGFLHEVTPMTLAWHKIRVIREKPTTQVILDNINGKAVPGEVVALMGASGAGKTTLLNSLMGRNLRGLEVSGEIIVGGNHNVKIGDISGYVQQEEMFMPTLTVYEHLMIQAGIRLANLPAQDIKHRITEVMEELGLIKCQSSIIGLSGVKKGISGGEAKRLMVASVLLDNPSILFLDEPTTGLDSHMAQSLMTTLQKLAKDGRTIVCTIHQPSTKIFNTLLDEVIFLADGQLAYYGHPKKAIPFFDSLGLVCPDDYNPADYIIDMLAIDRQHGNAEVALERIHKVTHGFVESELTAAVNEDLKTFEGYGCEEGFKDNRQRASFLSQVRLILKRSLIDNKRNPALARAKFIQKFIMGLFVGLLYWRTQYEESYTNISNINGALFYLVTELTYSALFGILTFMPNDFPLVVREHYDGLYRVNAYYIARVISYLPIFVLDGVLMLTIAYWMINLVPEFQLFLVFLGIGILVEQCAAAFGVMLSTVCPSYAIAISVAGPILTVLSLTGGLYANVEAVNVGIRWTQWLSWFRYGFEAMSINQWRNVKDTTCINYNHTETEPCHDYTGVLKELAFYESNFWYDILAMIAFIFMFYIIGYIGLYIRVHRNR